jgi:hypothetical protein
MSMLGRDTHLPAVAAQPLAFFSEERDPSEPEPPQDRTKLPVKATAFDLAPAHSSRCVGGDLQP